MKPVRSDHIVLCRSAAAMRLTRRSRSIGKDASPKEAVISSQAGLGGLYAPSRLVLVVIEIRQDNTNAASVISSCSGEQRGRRLINVRVPIQPSQVHADCLTVVQMKHEQRLSAGRALRDVSVSFAGDLVKFVSTGRLAEPLEGSTHQRAAVVLGRSRSCLWRGHGHASGMSMGCGNGDTITMNNSGFDRSSFDGEFDAQSL
jgi:hypothetical protein